MSRPVIPVIRKVSLVDADIASSWSAASQACPPGDCIVYIESSTNPSTLTAFTWQIWGSYDNGVTKIPLDTITKAEYTHRSSDYYYQVTLPAFPLFIFDLIQISGSSGIPVTIFLRS